MYKKGYVLMEEAGDGTGGGAAGGPKLDDVMRHLGAIVNGMKILAEGVTKMEERVSAFEAPAARQSAPAATPQEDDVDLDGLSNKELASVISTRMLKAFEEGPMKTVMAKIEELGTGLQGVTGKLAYTDVKGKFPEIDSWAAEVSAELKRNPALQPDEALVLAKAKNPDKQKEMELEAKKASDAAAPKRGFGGLTPTSDTGASEGRKVSQDDAIKSNWDKHMADFENVLKGVDTAEIG